jgi:hypothetical protein
MLSFGKKKSLEATRFENLQELIEAFIQFVDRPEVSRSKQCAARFCKMQDENRVADRNAGMAMCR